MIRAVIDTNVLVSAMISPAGNEALLLMAISQGIVMPLLSAEILDEYSGVLLRPRFAFPKIQIDALLDMLRRRGALLESVPPAEGSPDPDDNKFIACALAGKADFLVTGNRRHFPDHRLAVVRVVSALEILEIITLGL